MVKGSDRADDVMKVQLGRDATVNATEATCSGNATVKRRCKDAASRRLHRRDMFTFWRPCDRDGPSIKLPSIPKNRAKSYSTMLEIADSETCSQWDHPQDHRWEKANLFEVSRV